jgi:superfamily II DNA/RNA helicase
VFTRTKHGAKGLARQLNRSGVAAVELHGNLGQNARTRNLDAFHSGRASTLVATDIAARGIHVDDVSLVIHADPPVDHKAYLHRSGRTARAGNSGTVVTLATADQMSEVKQLTRAAGIAARTTRIASIQDTVLTDLAPGVRVLTDPISFDVDSGSAKQGTVGNRTGAGRNSNSGGGRGRRRGSDRSRSTATASTAADRQKPSAGRPAPAPGRSRRPQASTNRPSPATHNSAAFSSKFR